MKTGNKFALPIGLGIVAVFMTQNYISRKVQTTEFIVVKHPVKLGEKITPDSISKIKLPGDRAQLSKSFIPYDQKQNVIFTVAQRNLHDGDMLAWQDSDKTKIQIYGLKPHEVLLPIKTDGITVEKKQLMPGREVSFVVLKKPLKDDNSEMIEDIEIIGKYKIVTVGLQEEKMTTQSENNPEDRARNNDQIFTVAVIPDKSKPLDDKGMALELAYLQKRIVQVVFHNSEKPMVDESIDTIEDNDNSASGLAVAN